MLILCMRTVLSDMRTVCVGLSVNGIFHQAMMEGSRPTLEGALVGKSATTMTSSSNAMYLYGHCHVLILQALPNPTVLSVSPGASHLLTCTDIC